ncbi:flagellar hook-length control protein FliK [Sulfurimonas sp. RIFCSPLOWO2_12_36_12]|uniref:flagellar hook-length control protein FliK n=1 Tax=Sulfurimonas sp. RIFCSPLOWO2_12_36_12 TaxID=1802253 RepID=UPI000A550C0C|nr:flagellar hook-length control protein FliK [Sulfurimonas sp. RIFCSPLOWO2_12_36_12]
MVLLNMKNSKTSSSSSPLSLSTPKDKPVISFSDLLKGVSDKKDAKLIQNGSSTLALEGKEKSVITTKTASSKKDSPILLLANEENLTPNKTGEPLELNPKLTAALTKVEIKALVAEAKNYLKEKIQDSDGYKKSEIKELPNTLKALVEVAKKFDIDINKISFEEVKAHAEVKVQTLKAEKQEEIKVTTPKEAVQDKKASLEKDVRLEAPKEAVQDKKVSLEKELKTEAPKEIVQDKKPKIAETEEKQKNITLSNALVSNVEKSEIKNNEKFTEVQKEIKSTPLFKAQSVIEHTTTEQIVQAKANGSSFKADQKTSKERADETLKLLLRGEKPSVNNSALTADFSVATASVIAPTATTEGAKTLEHLLQGDSPSIEQSTSSNKMELLTTHNSDSFEVKLNEAKQMIKYLSADVKSAIEDYRSPFTRVKVQLNPQNLGEIDLTIVQRGKNLHVNISSNNTAINTLSMNVNELKVQLSNSGINNATLNFSNGSQSGDANAGGQHQQKQNEQRAHAEYNYFENEEKSEEILSSLEIIVPRYT